MTAAARVLAVMLLLGLLCASLVWAAEQEPANRLVLELTTETSALPFELPAEMANLPNMQALNAPKRMLSAEANYPHQAVEPIWVTCPADLGLIGNRLVLTVPQPDGATPGEELEEGEEGTPPEPTKFTLKLFWHLDEAQGPVVTEFDPEAAQAAGVPPPDLPLPGFTGPVPDPERTAVGANGKLPATVVGKGAYVLNTGGLTAPLDGFLPALQMLEPTTVAALDPNEGILLKWKPVAGARGYIIHAVGIVTENDALTEVIHWVSTTTQPPTRVQSGYEQATTITDDLKNGILLPPQTTQAQMPAGMFPGVSIFMLDVTAVGNDYYDATGGKVVRGKIRATWSAMKMAGMEQMPGLDGLEGGDEGTGDQGEGEDTACGDGWLDGGVVITPGAPSYPLPPRGG